MLQYEGKAVLTYFKEMKLRVLCSGFYGYLSFRHEMLGFATKVNWKAKYSTSPKRAETTEWSNQVVPPCRAVAAVAPPTERTGH